MHFFPVINSHINVISVWQLLTDRRTIHKFTNVNYKFTLMKQNCMSMNHKCKIIYHKFTSAKHKLLLLITNLSSMSHRFKIKNYKCMSTYHKVQRTHLQVWITHLHVWFKNLRLQFTNLWWTTTKSGEWI